MYYNKWIIHRKLNIDRELYMIMKDYRSVLAMAISLLVYCSRVLHDEHCVQEESPKNIVRAAYEDPQIIATY